MSPDQKLEMFSRQVVEIMPLMVREFAKREDNHLTQGKISCPQMVTLDPASQNDRITMTEIARALSITSRIGYGAGGPSDPGKDAGAAA